jgi:homogentisate 1,2-dioxygenase
MGHENHRPASDQPVWPHLWSRDGFLGTNSVVLRQSYLPVYQPASGPHGPHRFNILEVPTADQTDPDSLPTSVMTSREGLELLVSRRNVAMSYTVRNADADELHFVQSGSVNFHTEFGTIKAGTLDFVFIPRAIGYRVEPVAPGFASLILSSPQPLRIDTPAPLGMIYRGKSLRTPELVTGDPKAGQFELRIKSYDGVTRFISEQDPLAGIPSSVSRMVSEGTRG